MITQYSASAQSYYYTGTLSASSQIGLRTYTGYYTGGPDVVYGNINETISYDSGTGSFREYGTIALANPYSLQGGIFYNTSVFNGFYNQIIPVQAGTINLTIPGTIAFDMTGHGNYGPNGLASGASFLTDLLVPLSGSGVLNGTPFSGGLLMDLPLYTTINSVDSTGLQLTQAGQGAHGNALVTSSGTIGSFSLGNAPDLGAGLEVGFNYNLNGNFIPAPEPSTLSLFGLMGFFALMPLSRRLRAGFGAK